MSRTGNNVSMSRPSKTIDKKNPIKVVDKEVQKPHIQHTEESIIQEQGDKENASNINLANNGQSNDPINLGNHVFKIIAVLFTLFQERHYEAQGN